MNPQAAESSRGYLAQAGMMPTMLQIGSYGAVLHHVKAMAASGTTEAGAVMVKMQELPIKGRFTKRATLRADGQVIRDMHLARAKASKESERSPGLELTKI